MAMIEQPEREQAWRTALISLESEMTIYERVASQGDEEETEKAAQGLADKMRHVGSTHTDPKVQKVWSERAEVFAGSSKSERKRMLYDIGKGLAILLAIPFALAGAVLFAAGGIIYGVGSILKGVGNILTMGMLRTNSKTKDSK